MWCLLDRDIVHWDIFKDEDSLTLRVYLYLLATSNMYDSTLDDGRTVKKGQTVFSYRGIAKALGVKEGRVRTAVKNLVLTHKLTHESTHQYSVATLDIQGFAKTSNGKSTQKSTQKSTTSNYKKEETEKYDFGKGGIRFHK